MPKLLKRFKIEEFSIDYEMTMTDHLGLYLKVDNSLISRQSCLTLYRLFVL